MSTVVMECAVPESQRLIAVSLGKIAASRGQKGGINLHKNLLVATVLHKARTAYMVQHYNKQKLAQVAAESQPAKTEPESNVEMKEEDSSAVQTQSCDSSTSSPSVPSTPVNNDREKEGENENASGSTQAGPLHSTSSTSRSVVPDSAGVSKVQLSRCEDKENAPPCHSSAIPATLTPECHARLQNLDNPTESESNPTSDTINNNTKLSLSLGSMSQTSPKKKSPKSSRCYVRSSSYSVLKRRRLTDNENVCAPKVRILATRESSDNQNSGSASISEPMQCDSPQISSLVNIFNTSFANGLTGGNNSVQLTSSVSHVLDVTCAKEMGIGGPLGGVRQPLVLSV